MKFSTFIIIIILLYALFNDNFIDNLENKDFKNAFVGLYDDIITDTRSISDNVKSFFN